MLWKEVEAAFPMVGSYYAKKMLMNHKNIKVRYFQMNLEIRDNSVLQDLNFNFPT